MQETIPASDSLAYQKALLYIPVCWGKSWADVRLFLRMCYYRNSIPNLRLTSPLWYCFWNRKKLLLILWQSVFPVIGKGVLYMALEVNAQTVCGAHRSVCEPAKAALHRRPSLLTWTLATLKNSGAAKKCWPRTSPLPLSPCLTKPTTLSHDTQWVLLVLFAKVRKDRSGKCSEKTYIVAWRDTLGGRVPET